MCCFFRLRIKTISDFKLSLPRIELVIFCCIDDTETYLLSTSFSTGAEKVDCLVPVFVKTFVIWSPSFTHRWCFWLFACDSNALIPILARWKSFLQSLHLALADSAAFAIHFGKLLLLNQVYDQYFSLFFDNFYQVYKQNKIWW